MGIPHQPYSFLVKKLDSLIVAQDDKGRVRYSGTDASTVIQAAINALPADGGRVLIKAGTYTLTSAIEISKRWVFLHGEGRGTILRLADGANCAGIKILEGAGNLWIKQINLDGNKANQTVAVSGIHFAHTTTHYNSLLEKCAIWDWSADGITCDKLIYATVFRALYLETNDRSGLRALDGFNMCVVRDSYIYTNGNTGLHTVNSEGSQFFSNIIHGNSAHGHYHDRGYGLTISDVCRGNLIGIAFYRPTAGDGRNVAIGSAVYLNKRHGIIITNENYDVISGCEIWDNSQEAANSYDGVFLNNAIDTVVDGCRIGSAQQRYGVNEYGTSDYTLLDSCNLRGNTTGAHTVDALNSVVGDIIT